VPQKGDEMPRQGRSGEQIIAALRQAESRSAVKEVCRQAGISENTFYTWKRRYAGIGVSELRELRQLRQEARGARRVDRAGVVGLRRRKERHLVQGLGCAALPAPGHVDRDVVRDPEKPRSGSSTLPRRRWRSASRRKTSWTASLASSTDPVHQRASPKTGPAAAPYMGSRALESPAASRANRSFQPSLESSGARAMRPSSLISCPSAGVLGISSATAPMLVESSEVRVLVSLLTRVTRPGDGALQSFQRSTMTRFMALWYPQWKPTDVRPASETILLDVSRNMSSVSGSLISSLA